MRTKFGPQKASMKFFTYRNGKAQQTAAAFIHPDKDLTTDFC